jgi:hypothetical protein
MLEHRDLADRIVASAMEVHRIGQPLDASRFADA